MVVVDEVLHADQERVNNPQPHHREVLRIVPGKMETGFVLGDRVFFYWGYLLNVHRKLTIHKQKRRQG